MRRWSKKPTPPSSRPKRRPTNSTASSISSPSARSRGPRQRLQWKAPGCQSTPGTGQDRGAVLPQCGQCCHRQGLVGVLGRPSIRFEGPGIAGAFSFQPLCVCSSFIPPCQDGSANELCRGLSWSVEMFRVIEGGLGGATIVKGPADAEDVRREAARRLKVAGYDDAQTRSFVAGRGAGWPEISATADGFRGCSARPDVAGAGGFPRGHATGRRTNCDCRRAARA